MTPLREEDAHPADPEAGYGWEKLFTEQLCRYYRHDYGFETRIVRFHNVYGPLGTYDGGKEKAPAAISRKVALAPDGGEIEVWGDGQQTRSYMWIDDCVEGLTRLMASDYHAPLNLGTEELVSVDRLVDMVCKIAGKRLNKIHAHGQAAGRARTKQRQLAPANCAGMGAADSAGRRPESHLSLDRARAGAGGTAHARTGSCMRLGRAPRSARMYWGLAFTPSTWEKRSSEQSSCWRLAARATCASPEYTA